MWQKYSHLVYTVQSVVHSSSFCNNNSSNQVTLYKTCHRLFNVPTAVWPTLCNTAPVELDLLVTFDANFQILPAFLLWASDPDFDFVSLKPFSSWYILEIVVLMKYEYLPKLQASWIPEEVYPLNFYIFGPVYSMLHADKLPRIRGKEIVALFYYFCILQLVWHDWDH